MKTNYFVLVPVLVIGIYSCKKNTGGGNPKTGLKYNVITLASLSPALHKEGISDGSATSTGSSGRASVLLPLPQSGYPHIGIDSLALLVELYKNLLSFLEK